MREILITGAVLLIVALVLAKQLTEETQALIVGIGALVGAVYYTALPVAEASKSRRVAAGVYAFAFIWIAAAGYPFWKLVSPGDPIKQVSLTVGGEAQPLGNLEEGHYLVLAQVPRANLASGARYRMVVTTGGRNERLGGEFKRTTSARQRVGGTSTSQSVRTADYHEVKLASGEATIRLDSIQGSLSGGINVHVFPNAAPRNLWLGVQILLLAVAAMLDALFAERKRRSTLTVGACFTLLFIEFARKSIGPGQLFLPLIGAAIISLILAVVGGYLLNWLARAAARAVRRAFA